MKAKPLTKLPMEIKTLSPVHIASGREELFLDHDFVRQENQILVMDIDKMLSLVDEHQLKGQLEPKIDNLINPSQYSQCLAYKLAIEGATPQRIVAQQKDPYLKPYLPGSSIKGALRTAILWHHFQKPLNLHQLDPRPKYAFNRLERGILGQDSRHDLLRALKVADSYPLAPVTMEALEIRTYTLSGQPPGLKPHPNPRLVTWVEAIAEGTTFFGEIWLEVYLLNAQELEFPHKASWLRQFQISCQQFAKAIIDREQQFYHRYGVAHIASFYSELQQQIKSVADNQFLLQLGWGTGWHTKTIGNQLSSQEIRQIVRRYGLDRRRNYPVFPKTRRLAQKRNKPVIPLGWVSITLRQE
ncbi:type III-A CRISPR-associated RAMP protein Csm5 [Dehalococcoidales bacterium]|nr:type III-A CRISPR-associated RAMP protein Csm5 [Dehalococcoidales bacterium]